MSTSQRNNFALLQYYLREKLWRHSLALSGDLSSGLNDNVFRLWKAFALDQEGNLNEGLREYRMCEGKVEVNIAALMALEMIYRRNNDNAAADQAASRIQMEMNSAQPGAILQAAILLWHSGDLHKAREVVNGVLEKTPDYRDEYTSVQLIRGWIDIASGRGAYMDKANSFFEQVIASESAERLVDIDASMGRVLYLEKKAQYWAAQELLNKIVVAYPGFAPALIVKGKQLISMEDWDQALEVTNRILMKDGQNIEAIMLSILFYLVKEPRVSTAVQHVQELIKGMQLREPRNHQLFYNYSQCISRLAGGNLQLLGLTSSMAETATQLVPNNTDYQAEVAYQLLLKGDARQAQQVYRKASTAGDGNVIPLLGLIKCTILQGKLADAAQQVDFLNQIATKNAELLLLNAMLLWRKDRDDKASLEKLDQAEKTHREEVQRELTGAGLYIKLNPPFMLELAREYTQHCRTEPTQGPNQKQDPLVDKTRRILDLLIRHMPGCTEAQLLSSKLAFVSGDIDKANQMIAACIRQDHSLSEAHLLSAQIQQHAGNLQAANQALEQALSLDFEVKDQAQYNLRKGMVLCALGEYDPAKESLERALTLVDQPAAKRTGRPSQPLSVQDHVSLYLQLAQVYLKSRNAEKAHETIAAATKVFRDTSSIGRVTIAHAMLVARNDVDQALEILRSVSPTSEFFIQAKSQMAQIYLTQKQNRKMFAKCYEELVEAFPNNPQALIHLGEAYSSIQEPEKAIAAFEKARAADPNDTELAVRIGRTRVTTHDYQKALRYYRDAVASDPSRSNLRQDLAILFWRLDKISDAIRTLKESPVLAKPSSHDDLYNAVERVSLHLLIFKIHRASGDAQSACEALIQSRVFQNAVITKVKNEGSDIRMQQSHIASVINFQLGEFYTGQHLPDKALPYYIDALKHEQTNDAAMLALAKLYLRKGDLIDCEKYCNELLQINPSCEEALMMLADLMFRKNQYEDAAYNFLQLLEKRPDNYSAMVEYVLLLRRAGHLPEAPQVFQHAEASMRPGQKPDPGLCYAKGLYYRYTNQSADALREFNLGRVPREGPWAQKCLVALIETYILPDNENLWTDTTERTGEAAEPLRVAEQLIPEVKDPNKRTLLEGYCNLAWKRKDTIERANTKFYELIENATKDAGEDADDVPHVPAFVGIAIGLQLSKQTGKARGNLKRMTKSNYNPDEDDDFERGWLLLADMYIQSGKYDLAQDLLNKAIRANKSCCRAWELMGLIYEKEQSYKDASDCYENAWKLVNEAEAAIGFKLAFNYMKARKFVQAIDVAKKVLDKHPQYPKIKRDVLERARNSLRP